MGRRNELTKENKREDKRGNVTDGRHVERERKESTLQYQTRDRYEVILPDARGGCTF